MADLLACSAWSGSKAVAQLQFCRRANEDGAKRLPDVVVALPFVDVNPGGKDGVSSVWSSLKLGGPKLSGFICKVKRPDGKDVGRRA